MSTTTTTFCLHLGDNPAVRLSEFTVSETRLIEASIETSGMRVSIVADSQAALVHWFAAALSTVCDYGHEERDEEEMNRIEERWGAYAGDTDAQS